MPSIKRLYSRDIASKQAIMLLESFCYTMRLISIVSDLKYPVAIKYWSDVGESMVAFLCEKHIDLSFISQCHSRMLEEEEGGLMASDV